MARVLIVDDSADARLLVRTVLAHAGHVLIEAADAAEGLAKAVEVRPDLMLLDLALPSMSGAQLLRTLRGDSRTRPMRIALYTATAMSGAMRDLMDAYDIRCLIPKPSEPLELLATIQRALNPEKK